VNKLHIQLAILRRLYVLNLKKPAPDSASNVVGDSILIKQTYENSFSRKIQVDVLLERKHLVPLIISQRQGFGVYVTMNFRKSLKRILSFESLRESALFRV